MRPEGPVGSGLRSTAPICFWNSPRESLVPFLDMDRLGWGGVEGSRGRLLCLGLVLGGGGVRTGGGGPVCGSYVTWGGVSEMMDR